MKSITVIISACAVSLAALSPLNTSGKTFSSPEEAVRALADAAKAKDRSALREVMGPGSEDVQMADKVQAEEELAAFSGAYDSANRIVRESDTRATLEVGTNHWSFPIPLVKQGAQWQFDIEAGKEEIINRRIGRNELSVLETARAYVEAQRQYAGRDRDNDEVLEYAQHILSTQGQKDGLYWSPDLGGELSPLGPLVAVAHGEGYMKSTGEKSGPRAFHGYYFKILTGQGASAPGGKYTYIINSNMIGGFGLIAWPADYGRSGVMTFIVNQQGKVFQKDLGASTMITAQATKEYEPNKTWTLSRD